MYILELIQGRAFNFAFRKLSLYLISNLTLCSRHFRILNQAGDGANMPYKKNWLQQPYFYIYGHVSSLP